MRYLTPIFAMACVNAVVVATTVAACGGDDGAAGSGGPAVTASPTAGSRLTVVVKASPQAASKTWTLTCDPTGGDHPNAAKACAALAQHPNVFKATPKDQACTQIYGGPQVATVTGVWRGQPVNAKFTGLNGCEVDRWSQASALLGAS
jgi:Subtilisin inhibitor-like